MHRYLRHSTYTLGDVDFDSMRFYTSGFILSSPIQNDTRAAINAVLSKAMNAMPWVGGGIQGEAALIMNDNRVPIVSSDLDIADTDAKKQQWAQFCTAFRQAIAPAFKQEQQAAAAEAKRLAANTEFWNTVYRINLAVATVGMSELAQVVKDKWAELQDRIKEWNDTKAWIQRIIDSPDCPADKAQKLKAKLDEMNSSVSGKITDLTSKVPGLAPALKAEQGLGIVPVLSALASVPTAVSIAAIVGVIGLVVYAISTMKGVVTDLGLDAVGDALRQTTKLLGPFVGVAILGIVGLIVYKKFSKPKPA